jgi:hypothetical protein
MGDYRSMYSPVFCLYELIINLHGMVLVFHWKKKKNKRKTQKEKKKK